MANAYKSAFTSNNISSGFQKAGIVPFVPLNVLSKLNDWNPIIHNKYVPNEESTEVSWTEMKHDKDIIDYSTIDISNQAPTSCNIIQVPIDQPESIVIEAALTFKAPIEQFISKPAGDNRLPIYNQVYNKSDLYNVVKQQQGKVKEKELKLKAIQDRRDEREAKKVQNEKEENFLELASLVRCFCKRKCGLKCVCRIKNQICIYLCKCQCEDKDCSAKNQFCSGQAIETIE